MPLPPGVGEGLLLGITVLVGAFVIRRIRRRNAFTAVVREDPVSYTPLTLLTDIEV